MTTLSTHERQRAFGVWLRTGRLPPIRTADGLELKFNPIMSLATVASRSRPEDYADAAKPKAVMR